MFDAYHLDGDIELQQMLDATASLSTVVWPSSNATLVAAMGDYGQTFSDLWAMNAASGNEPNLIGSDVLVPTSSPTQNVAGPGSDVAVELPSDGTGANMQIGNSTGMDVDEGDLILAFVFRIMTAPAAARYIVSKIGTDFYGVQVNVTNNNLIFRVDGDALVTATVAADHADGEWHVCLAVVDRNDGNLRIASDLGTSAKISIAALGGFTNTGRFAFGRHASTSGHWRCALLAGGNGLTCAGTLIDNLQTAATDLHTYLGL